jgi:hypothetical protein
MSVATLLTPRLLARPLDPRGDVLAAIRRSGITAINFTISEMTFEGTISNIAAVESLVDLHPEVFLTMLADKQPAAHYPAPEL